MGAVEARDVNILVVYLEKTFFIRHLKKGRPNRAGIYLLKVENRICKTTTE